MGDADGGSGACCTTGEAVQVRGSALLTTNKGRLSLQIFFLIQGCQSSPEISTTPAPEPAAPPMKGKGPPPVVKGMYWKLSNSDAVRWTAADNEAGRDAENDITFATEA